MTLIVNDLSVELGEVKALHCVRFSATTDRLTGVIGPPGSGKTVLLKAIAGLVPSAKGMISFEGAVASEATEWLSRVGMAFQNDALFDAMSVFENVAFPLRRRRVSESETRARAMEMLERVGLADAAQKMPGEISGGMRKRCGIARAAVVRPAIGVFDDPTAGLDPETSDAILQLIVSLSKRQETVCVVVSNDLPSVLAVVGHVVMLHGGRGIFSGTPEELRRSEDPVVYQFIRGERAGPL